MRSEAKRVIYNPFIVLSDVTISTLVVLTCLLMLFSACMFSSTTFERQKAQLAERIRAKQAILADAAEKPENRAAWDTKLAVLHARGLQSFLFRMYGENLFDKDHPAQLSEQGRQAISMWARVFGPLLSAQQGSESASIGEVQVQGHCGQWVPDPWVVSTQRAMAAAMVVQGTDGFPKHLLSVSGFSWHRRAHLPRKEVVRKERERRGDLDLLSDDEVLKLLRLHGQKKKALEDRIDFLIVYSGDDVDNNFVAATDGINIYGPKNDASSPDL